jgi:hypothetical protein
MPAEARVHPTREKPDLASEDVLNGTLTPFGLILSPFAPYLLAPSDVDYTELAFCGADLQSLWPRTNRGGRAGEPKRSSYVRGEDPELLRSAIDWMQTAASHGVLPKRDSALIECMQATGCTYRQALEARNRLPAEVKGTRGRPATGNAKG